ncbi:M48 family metallopeptidase [Acaryochloris sp. CCMEE 5410]|uniref:M48 family metallopeptidase n=1 Tax=Acaryochloris sp. CCMEE 5410 TaxID=310037 RepID=UPI00031FBDEC|nr:M48 family metallopeptidase [Acaryochloris sp. CCMEE 5410]KAI9133050.1 M48 family metalloprotease [Acaryochloris sp. CCMEE 5410]
MSGATDGVAIEQVKLLPVLSETSEISSRQPSKHIYLSSPPRSQTDSSTSTLAVAQANRSLSQSEEIADDPSLLSEPDEASGQRDTRPDKGEADKQPPSEDKGEADDQTSKSSEEEARLKVLIEADRLYQSGQIEAATALYQQAKRPFSDRAMAEPLAEPMQDPAQLPPGGRVYWREAQAGSELQLKTRIFVPLRLLVKEYPEFVPGHLRLAEELVGDDKNDEALGVMARAAALYPNQPELQKGLMQQQTQVKQWLEASITARQFSLLNPDHPEAPEFARLSEEYQDRFRARLRTQITNNTIGSFITGALGIAITGSPIPGLSALQTSILLLRGESAVGDAIANRAKRQLPLIENPDVQDYIDRIAQKLTPIAGREFNYQFYVVNNEKLNAFALPGGKIFINGGAILKSNSEAELAGLIAHELAHAVLSHGFQIATESAEAGGLTRLIPYVGGLFTSVVVADYSREMERQADVLGTRLLASANYAADGLRNLMVTLGKEDKPFVAPWFSTHPGSLERVQYLETLITDNGYNRYAYEGIEEHQRIQALVRAELKKAKEEEEQSEESSAQSESDTPPTDSDTTNDTNSDTESKSSVTSPPEGGPSVEEPQTNPRENTPKSSVEAPTSDPVTNQPATTEPSEPK